MRSHRAECRVDSERVFFFVQLQGSTPEPPFSFKKTLTRSGTSRKVLRVVKPQRSEKGLTRPRLQLTKAQKKVLQLSLASVWARF